MSDSVSKKRGRPRKVIPKFFTGECQNLNALSVSVAKELGIARGSVSDQLARVGCAFGAMSELQQHAPLKRKGPGNRPKIHLQRLLIDCALVHEAATGKSAHAELRKIVGWDEAKDIPGAQVAKSAKAVLTALGVRHSQSLRQQARMALQNWIF